MASLARGPHRPVRPCWLDGPIALLTTPTDALGGAAVPLALPPALLGARFTGQFFALDAAGPALGLLSSTGAVEVVIGS